MYLKFVMWGQPFWMDGLVALVGAGDFGLAGLLFKKTKAPPEENPNMPHS